MKLLSIANAHSVIFVGYGIQIFKNMHFEEAKSWTHI